jgi:hypothetical protein
MKKLIRFGSHLKRQQRRMAGSDWTNEANADLGTFRPCDDNRQSLACQKLNGDPLPRFEAERTIKA